MGLRDLVSPTVDGRLSLPAALNALRRGEIPHPDTTAEGLGGVLTQQELPPAPAAGMSRATANYIDQAHREAQEQAKLDAYELRLRMAAKGIST
jgi:hypothetical protein